MSSMPTSLWIAVGDADLHDALNLNDGAIWIPVEGSFKAPPPFRRTFRSRSKGTAQTIDKFRSVSWDALLQAPTDDQLYAYLQLLEWKLAQAEAMSGQYPEDGRGVCLWVAWGGSSQYTYFDIEQGQLTVTRGDEKYGSAVISEVAIDLTCRPLAHGQPKTYGPFGPLTIGTGASIWLPNLPGSADGLPQLTLTDASGNNEAIGTYRIGTFSLPMAGQTDYTAWVDAQPFQAGIAHADATALDGVSCARVTLSSAFQGVALFQSPGGAAEHGQFDLFLKVKDATNLLTQPQNVTATGSGGGSPILVAISALDASGNETAATVPISVANASSGVTINWAPPALGTLTAYRVYTYNFGNGVGGFLSWAYCTVTPPTVTQTIIVTGGTTSPVLTSLNPPTVSAVQGAQIIPFYGVMGTNGSPTALIPGTLRQTAIANSNYEMVRLDAPALPPIATPEGGTPPPWCVVIEVRTPTAGVTPTLDISGLWLAKSNQPSIEVDLGPAANGAPAVVVLDSRRNDQVGATVATQYIAPSRTNLVAEYLMNQGSGTSLTDTSGSGNTGTLQTGTGWALDAAIAGVTGSSNCLTVAGGNGVSIATLTNIPIGNSNYSFSALVKPTATGGWPLQWGANTTNNTTGTFLSSTFVTHDWWANNVVANIYVLNAWHVIAGTWDGTTRSLYIDGALVASDKPAAHAATAANFRLGFQFTGRLGPVRIWSRVLSAFEIARYQGQLPQLVGQATAIGQLLLGPGSATIAIDADLANGAHDVVNAAVTVSLRYIPRFAYLRSAGI